MTDYFEKGLALFRLEPELLGAEVWRRAAKETLDRQYEFVAGYMKGRHQRDEYEQEKSNDAR